MGRDLRDRHEGGGCPPPRSIFRHTDTGLVNPLLLRSAICNERRAINVEIPYLLTSHHLQLPLPLPSPWLGYIVSPEPFRSLSYSPTDGELTTDGHLLEFPFIRVDCFTPPPSRPKTPWMLPHPANPSLPDRRSPHAQLYLLTHVHTDHLTGLNDSFTGHIICSPDTKRMLLRLEAERERSHRFTGVREVKKRKYEGLCARQSDNGVVDYIVSKHQRTDLTIPRKHSTLANRRYSTSALKRCASRSGTRTTARGLRCE